VNCAIALTSPNLMWYGRDVQPTIKRLNGSLQWRGFKTWIDVECMSGSTVTAMADAIDNAAAVAYAVTEKCESSHPSHTSCCPTPSRE
jgi:hypothetical protein